MTMNPSGGAVQKLSLEACGIEGNTFSSRAAIAPSGFKYLATGGDEKNDWTWGYWFDSADNCVNASPSKWYAGRHVALSDDSLLVSTDFEKSDDGIRLHLKHSYPSSADIYTAELSSPANDLMGLNYRTAGGGMAVIGDRIYLAFSTEPNVSVFSLEGDFLGTIGETPGWFKRLTQDESGDTPESMRRIASFFRETQWLLNMVPLSDNILALQFQRNGEDGLWTNLIDLDGTNLLGKPWEWLPLSISTAKDGFVYFTERIESQNAVVHKYRLVGQ